MKITWEPGAGRYVWVYWFLRLLQVIVLLRCVDCTDSSSPDGVDKSTHHKKSSMSYIFEGGLPLSFLYSSLSLMGCVDGTISHACVYSALWLKV